MCVRIEPFRCPMPIVRMVKVIMFIEGGVYKMFCSSYPLVCIQMCFCPYSEGSSGSSYFLHDSGNDCHSRVSRSFLPLLSLDPVHSGSRHFICLQSVAIMFLNCLM